MTTDNQFACELPGSPFVTLMKSGFDIGLMLDEDLIAHFGAGGCAPVEGSVPLVDPFAVTIYQGEPHFVQPITFEMLLASALTPEIEETRDSEAA